MRVFISEFLVGGAFAGTESRPSMRSEGLAMLQAVVEDIGRLADWSAVITLDAAFSFPTSAEVIRIDRPEQEAAVFHRLSGEVDAVLVIAPETGGILADRCRQVKQAGPMSWNCSPESIDLCGDKLRLAEHLRRYELPTLRTALADLTAPDFQGSPVVLKPRDGAGSEMTFLVQNQHDWDVATQAFQSAGQKHNCLIQPFTRGRNFSIGLNVSFDGKSIECLAIAEQRLSDDGRFRYLGGCVPASISPAAELAIQGLVLNACQTIPGLKGYVGFDILLPDDGQPLIVEINPRLTTSYVGYRQFYRTPLPEHWLDSSRHLIPCDKVGGIATPIEFKVVLCHS